MRTVTYIWGTGNPLRPIGNERLRQATSVIRQSHSPRRRYRQVGNGISSSFRTTSRLGRQQVRCCVDAEGRPAAQAHRLGAPQGFITSRPRERNFPFRHAFDQANLGQRARFSGHPIRLPNNRSIARRTYIWPGVSRARPNVLTSTIPQTKFSPVRLGKRSVYHKRRAGVQPGQSLHRQRAANRLTERSRHGAVRRSIRRTGARLEL